MKCPLCLQEMNKSQNNMFYCGTDNCSLRYIDMPKKALEEFAESYQNRLTDCKRIGNLNEELTRTRKALDVATVFIKGISQTVINDCDNQYVVLGNFKKFAHDTIEQITTLEQEQ